MRSKRLPKLDALNASILILTILFIHSQAADAQSSSSTSHASTAGGTSARKSPSSTPARKPPVPDPNADLLGTWVEVGTQNATGMAIECAKDAKAQTDCSLVFAKANAKEPTVIRRTGSNIAFTGSAPPNPDGSPAPNHIFLIQMKGNVLSGKLLPSKDAFTLYRHGSQEEAQEIADRQAELAQKRALETWKDPATGLVWTKKDSGATVSWNDAAAYCQNLRLVGYNDWRLPTMDELQGIYDATVNVQSRDFAGRPGIDHIKGELQLSDSPWSSSPSAVSGQMMAFAFSNGNHLNRRPQSHQGALCVRRSGE
jgi:hypothetical protein